MHHDLGNVSPTPLQRWSNSSDHAYLSLLVEHSPIAIVILNSSHQTEHCNPAFERVFGYTLEELRQHDFDRLISGRNEWREARHCTRSVLQGDKIHLVTRRRHKSGVQIDVDLHGIPLVVDGVLRGVYGLYVDISERTRTETSLRQLSRELLELQEKEKRRLARELHDATSQDLALLNMSLGKLDRLLGGRDKEIKDLVGSIRELTRQCSQKIRSVSYLLHPPLLQEAGLVPAISWLTEGFSQRSGIPVDLQISKNLGRLAETTELAIFRVVQESLSNVLRHSPSSSVVIRLRRHSKTVRLQVRNCEAGIALQMPLRHAVSLGVGITGMRERVEELGGQLVVHAATGTTLVAASLPVEARIDA